MTPGPPQHDTTSAVLAHALARRPDIAAHLASAHDAAWASGRRRHLELCRLRIAALLGCQGELSLRTADSGVDEATIEVLDLWPRSDRFDDRDRACLAFCEQFVIDVANLDDALADGVRRVLGEQGLVDFTSALLVIEQRQRLRLAFERLALVGTEGS